MVDLVKKKKKKMGTLDLAWNPATLLDLVKMFFFTFPYLYYL